MFTYECLCEPDGNVSLPVCNLETHIKYSAGVGGAHYMHVMEIQSSSAVSVELFEVISYPSLCLCFGTSDLAAI